MNFYNPKDDKDFVAYFMAKFNLIYLFWKVIKQLSGNHLSSSSDFNLSHFQNLTKLQMQQARISY